MEENYLNKGKILTISLYNINGKNDKFYKQIHLGLHRKIFFIKKLDLTLIEILTNDEIPQDYFFEIDEDYGGGKEYFNNICKNRGI